MTGQVAEARLWSVQATARTLWHVVALTDRDGQTGWGEATLEGQTAALEALAPALLATLPGRMAGNPQAATTGLPYGTLPQAALSSAVEQALWDLAARRAGQSLAELLGGPQRDRIGLYANFNRRTRNRSPEGMVASLQDAVAAGFTAFKIAPFDEVRPDQTRVEMRAAMQPGLHRLAAIRAALGADARLMADCHWRFDRAGAEELIDACEGLGLYWLECPIPENAGTIADIAALRRKANAKGMRLAGLETEIRREGFAPWLRAGACDVMMPDVKYAGGPAEMLALAEDFARHGVAFSPHNPSGPVCHAQSLHLCAALAQTDLLEVQFDETPVFDGLAGLPLTAMVGGTVALPAATPGFGFVPDLHAHGATLHFSTGKTAR
ncbi:MAG: mandelate racemase/muconate lactonizing enzyme family protein [Pseudorhodobacter sp.]